MTFAELSAAEDRRQERQKRQLSVAVLVIAVVVSGVLLWRDLRDDRPHASVGSFVATQNDIAPTWRRTVLVPGTGYEVAAAVSDDVAQDATVHTRQAPDDGTFVGLTLRKAARPGPTVPDFDLNEVTGPRFVVVADGRRYGLPSNDIDRGTGTGVATPTRLAVSGWLAVAGSADRLSLETSWQGRTQRLDLRSGSREAGDFAPLYRQRGVGEITAATDSCGRAVIAAGWRVGQGVPASCAYRADRLPWTKELGWAKPGRQWLMLTLTTTTPSDVIRRVGDRDVAYADTGYGTSSAGSIDASESPDRVDGRGPVALRRVDRDASAADTTVLVFDVARTTSRPTAVVTLRPVVRARTVPEPDTRPEVGMTWTVPLSD